MYFVNLPTQERPKIAEAVASVASMDLNLPIEKLIFLYQQSAVIDVNFQKTLQREAL